MRLGANEFLRRFLLHVLPDGFHRIRHYGFLAKGDRSANLARVRELLRVVHKPRESADPGPQAEKRKADTYHATFALCPDCGGRMRRIDILRISTRRRLSVRHVMTNSPAVPQLGVFRLGRRIYPPPLPRAEISESMGGWTGAICSSSARSN
jgi:hypothetical protein